MIVVVVEDFDAFGLIILELKTETMFMLVPRLCIGLITLDRWRLNNTSFYIGKGKRRKRRSAEPGNTKETPGVPTYRIIFQQPQLHRIGYTNGYKVRSIVKHSPCIATNVADVRLVRFLQTIVEGTKEKITRLYGI